MVGIVDILGLATGFVGEKKYPVKLVIPARRIAKCVEVRVCTIVLMQILCYNERLKLDIKILI